MFCVSNYTLLTIYLIDMQHFEDLEQQKKMWEFIKQIELVQEIVAVLNSLKGHFLLHFFTEIVGPVSVIFPIC